MSTGASELTTLTLPQRCPYCLGEARVEPAPEAAVLLIQECACTANTTLRVPAGLARRRWRELGVR